MSLIPKTAQEQQDAAALKVAQDAAHLAQRPVSPQDTAKARAGFVVPLKGNAATLILDYVTLDRLVERGVLAFSDELSVPNDYRGRRTYSLVPNGNQAASGKP